MKKLIFVITILFLLIQAGISQSISKKLELGFSTSRLSNKYETPKSIGIGIYGSYNIFSYLKITSDFSYYPDDKKDVIKGGRKFYAFIGPEMGITNDKWGFYLKLLPGYFYKELGEYRDFEGSRIAIWPPPSSWLKEKHSFALNYGGTIQFYGIKNFRPGFSISFIRPGNTNSDFMNSELLIFSLSIGYLLNL